APASGTPTGTVTFSRGSVGGTFLGTASLDASGIATLSVSNLPVGLRNIFASYGGDSTFISSNSPTPASITVSLASTATAVALSSSDSVFGEPVTATHTVAARIP